MTSDAKSILTIRLSALGDIAMTLPEIYSACLANPEYRFVVLTRRRPAGMFINPPANLSLEIFDDAQSKGIKGLWQLFRRLRKDYNIVAIADLHDVLRTKILRLFFRLSGVAKIKHISKRRAEKRRLCSGNPKDKRQLQPTVERYADVFRALGLNLRDSFRSLYGSGKADDAEFAPVEPKLPGEKWIAVAPFARHPGKVYPPELMEKVLASLAADPVEKRIFIFGFGDSENEIIERWRSNIGSDRIINMAAMSLGFRKELALLSRCDVMLSMDSANMHLASLVALPAVSIWGATHPFAGFLGFRQNPADAVGLDLDCRPCSVYGNKPCRFGDYRCLRGINPQLIVAKIRDIIANKKT